MHFDCVDNLTIFYSIRLPIEIFIDVLNRAEVKCYNKMVVSKVAECPSTVKFLCKRSRSNFGLETNG